MFMFGLNAVAGSGGAAVAAQTASIHTAGAPQFKELPYLPRYDTNVIIFTDTIYVEDHVSRGVVWCSW